jgi:hypothetical protein
MRAAITECDWTARRKGGSSDLRLVDIRVEQKIDLLQARSIGATQLGPIIIVTVPKPHRAPHRHALPDRSAPLILSTPNLSDITRTSKSAADRCFYYEASRQSCCGAKESNVTPSHHRLQAPTANRTTRLTSWSLPQSTTRLNALTTQTRSARIRGRICCNASASRP